MRRELPHGADHRSKKTVSRFDEARRDPGLAAECLLALYQGRDDAWAEVGALLVAEDLAITRARVEAEAKAAKQG